VANFLFDPGISSKDKGVAKSVASRLLGGCAACGLHVNAHTPKMEPFGKGNMGILVVGQSPGKDEDAKGRPFIGKSGVFLWNSLGFAGVHRDDDCWLTNAVQCCPGKHKVVDKHINACRHRLVRQIHKLKPKLILALGSEAMKSVFTGMKLQGAMAMRGRVIPVREFDCWCGCLLHPSYVLRNGESADLVALWERDLERALEVL